MAGSIPAAGWRRALSGGLAAALVFALLEGAASLGYFAYYARTHYWRPLPERAHTVYDPELGWTSERSRVARDVFGPGLHVTTNARGFRNLTELADEVPEGKTRVVALGDSFTLGYDVGDSDSWPAWLERLCPRLEVPNMGQAGYGIDQSQLWYERDGGAFAHQVLVLAFIDDDLLRVQHADMLGYGKPVLELVDGELAVRNVPVPRSPYLLPVLTQNLSLLEKLRLVELPRALIAHFAAPRAASVSPSDDETARLDEAIFRAIERTSAKRGSELLLVHLPHLAGGNPSELADIPAAGVAALERVRADGLAFADLAAEFRGVPDRERRALFNLETVTHGAGGHYSPKGNRFVAQAIADRMGRLGLIPADACGGP